MQVISIAGNVGKDAVLRNTNGGDQVLGFSVAVSNGKDKDSTWFDCAVWGKRAVALESHIKKGAKLAINGDLGTREHEGKTYLTVRVNALTFMGDSTKSEGRGGGGGSDYASQEPVAGRGRQEVPFDDDVPFIRPYGRI